VDTARKERHKAEDRAAGDVNVSNIGIIRLTEEQFDRCQQMIKAQLYLIAAIALVLVLAGYVQAQEIPKEAPRARLAFSYPTKTSGCEHRMAVIFDFLSELSNNPSARGYVVVYPPTIPLWIGENRVNQVRSQIKYYRFDASRLTIVKGDPRGNAETEFWIVPGGAENPQLKEPDGIVNGAPIAQITAPKNFTEENADGCFWGELWLDGYAAEMNHGWEYPGRIVIYTKNLAAFREQKRDLTEALETYGVPARRLTFVRKPLPRDGVEAVELWILPVKKGLKTRIALPGK
jgi:hypothetical protein